MTLPKNVGTMDRNIRLAVAGVLILAGLIANSVLLDILGLIVLATGAFGTCLAYVPLKIDTTEKKEG
ncbi:hypothetical protein ThidrDRAFT_3350 [Thiorhodococcus drewsii AZ1]|uniref:Inner membrane protein YgaP-like transmembrane domain-containing protein n=1 Tax=Thiorhodococcus drewsii AZ1 TaxID=765913 RepID=G2E4Y7_9GAMM|nr:DUF2892 domain-containing protein [Thiorhodococcus drewsii]EGV29158.1 hypothetical protein ThidrDRAFT_3350 [Thiorhodococcus drewsii AZ1]